MAEIHCETDEVTHKKESIAMMRTSAPTLRWRSIEALYFVFLLRPANMINLSQMLPGIEQRQALFCTLFCGER